MILLWLGQSAGQHAREPLIMRGRPKTSLEADMLIFPLILYLVCHFHEKGGNSILFNWSATYVRVSEGILDQRIGFVSARSNELAIGLSFLCCNWPVILTWFERVPIISPRRAHSNIEWLSARPWCADNRWGYFRGTSSFQWCNGQASIYTVGGVLHGGGVDSITEDTTGKV